MLKQYRKSIFLYINHTHYQQFLYKLRRRASARNVSSRISLRWPIHIINSVDKTKFSVSTWLGEGVIYYRYLSIILRLILIIQNISPVLSFRDISRNLLRGNVNQRRARRGTRKTIRIFRIPAKDSP